MVRRSHHAALSGDPGQPSRYSARSLGPSPADKKNVQREEQRQRRDGGAAADARRRAQLEKESRDYVLAQTSHELRTPLSVLALYLDRMLRNTQTNSEQHALLETMQTHLRIAARLVDDLQDLVRMQRRTLALTLAPVDLHALIQARYRRSSR